MSHSQIFIDNYVDKNLTLVPQLKLLFIYLSAKDMGSLNLVPFFTKIGKSIAACNFSKNTVCTGPAQLTVIPGQIPGQTIKACTYNGNILDILIGMVITSTPQNLQQISQISGLGFKAVHSFINFLVRTDVSIAGYCDAVQFNPVDNGKPTPLVNLPKHNRTDIGIVDIYNVCNTSGYKGICTTLMHHFLSKIDNYRVFLGVKVFEDDGTTINKNAMGAIKCYTGLGFIFMGHRDNESIIGQKLDFEIFNFILETDLFKNLQKSIEARQQGIQGVKSLSQIIQENRSHFSNEQLLSLLESDHLPPKFIAPEIEISIDMDNKDPCEEYKEVFGKLHEFMQKVTTFVHNKTTYLKSLAQLPILQNYPETSHDLNKYKKENYVTINIRFDADKIMKLLHTNSISPIRDMGESSGSLYYSLSSQNFVSVLFPNSDSPHASHGIKSNESDEHQCQVLSQDTFTFHTHPANIYEHYPGVIYGPPSIQDLCLFIYSNIVANQKAHLVIAKEGIYIITLNLTNFRNLIFPLIQQYNSISQISPANYIINMIRQRLNNIRIVHSKIDISSGYKIVGPENDGSYWFITHDINSIPKDAIINIYNLFDTRNIQFNNVIDFTNFWISFFDYGPINFIDIDFIDGDVYHKGSINNTLDIPIVFFNYTGTESDYAFDNHDKIDKSVFDSMQKVLPHTKQYYDGMYIISTLYRLLEAYLDDDNVLYHSLLVKLQNTINTYENIEISSFIKINILERNNSQSKQYVECLIDIIFNYILNKPYIDSSDFRNYLLKNPFVRMDTQITLVEKNLLKKMSKMFPSNIFKNIKVERYLLINKMIEIGSTNSLSPNEILQFNIGDMSKFLEYFLTQIDINSIKINDEVDESSKSGSHTMTVPAVASSEAPYDDLDKQPDFEDY